MSADLAGRVVVITGAADGIGRAIAERCSLAGASVAVTSRDAGRAEAAAAALPGPGLGLALDVRGPEDPNLVIDAVLEKWGRVDCLINNSGAAIDNYITGFTEERWNEALAVNLSGPFWLLRSVVPPMKAAGHGSIVNMVSWAGLRGNPGQAGYSAAKAGLLGLTRTAAKELGRFGIRVNAISPSVYPTAMTRGIDPGTRAEALRHRPLPREGTADEVAEAALFLLSDRSSYTTGQVLHVDGGLHLG
jgi:3-oxoacyl-[acyl-carrier protein] reductase